MIPVLETDRLTKRYGRARGIEDLTLSVRPAEVFGFLGPNGAGKTTTIRTLLGLLHPTSGSARVFGLDSRRESLAIRARTGNLPGDFAYDERMTGAEMLELFARLRGMRDLGGATALAERFDADLRRPLRELSRGNRQKVGLIQALFHAPELIVLDEPTTGLDPLMQEEFLRVMAESRARGATVFLSSHELDEVERSCDRVAIVRGGRLVAVDEVEAMRARAYREVAVRFREPADARPLAHLPGVSDLTQANGTVRFRAAGDLDAIVKALAARPVADVEIRRPSLEDLFLTYYEGGPPC